MILEIESYDGRDRAERGLLYGVSMTARTGRDEGYELAIERIGMHDVATEENRGQMNESVSLNSLRLSPIINPGAAVLPSHINSWHSRRGICGRYSHTTNQYLVRIAMFRCSYVLGCK